MVHGLAYLLNSAISHGNFNRFDSFIVIRKDCSFT